MRIPKPQVVGASAAQGRRSWRLKGCIHVRGSTVCQVGHNARGELQQVGMLRHSGTGHAEHERYFGPGPGRFSIQAGLIAKSLADSVRPLV